MAGITNIVLPINRHAAWASNWMDHCLKLLRADGLLYFYGFAEILAHVAIRYPVEHQRWPAWHYKKQDGAQIAVLAAIT